MSLAFAALLVSILTLGLAIISMIRRHILLLLFDNVNRIPAEDVIYLIHELPVYPFITRLHLLRDILRSVVASVAVVQRLVIISVQRPIWTFSIAQILDVIIGSAIHKELSLIMYGAVQTLCAQKREA